MSFAYFFLLLLWISLHAFECDARHLVAVNRHEKITSQLPIKNEEMKNRENSSSPPKENLFLSKKKGVTRNEDRKGTKASDKIPKDGKIISGGKAQDDQFSASVSWRVPHKKKRIEKHPGVTMDYSPPKTHPPSHN